MVQELDANMIDSSTIKDGQADSSTALDANGNSSLPESTGSREVNEENEENSENIRFDKHPRFQELRGKVKEYESRVKELEDQLANTSVKKESPVGKIEVEPETPKVEAQTEAKKDFLDSHVQKLVSMGYEKVFARDLAKNMWELAQDAGREVVGQRIAPIESQYVSQKVEKTYQEFGKKHADIYKDGNILPEIEQKMEAAFKSLPKDLQRELSKSGVEGLEYLYWKIAGTATAKPAVQEVNKKLGSTLGKTSTTMSKVTEDSNKGKDIKNMSDVEYEEYRKSMGLGSEG